uniref:NADH dehydrogenase subunit 4 n=1 Tax=Creptotrematina aguirrepequenoi TaxID=985756 RepID=UPI003002314A|nr:NADH dehydrogenase subunit 4 [Creptotrematina aguirrepequenoi]
MKFQNFDVFGGLLGFIVALFLAVIFSWSGAFGFKSMGCGWFFFDGVSFFLTLLTFFLFLSLYFFFDYSSYLPMLMILLSLFSSVGSYCCNHALLFWGFYEMSMVPLLFLLVLESPYSERYVASWYLLGYVVFTSLPMVLCIFYVSLGYGTFNMGLWFLSKGCGVGVFFILAILFITKMPLAPFHSWLPMVHAEATSSVSVCLSGYMMKLGVLGVYRFCSFLLPGSIFSKVYMCVALIFSVLFFFSACRELDGKRWLAFMSLSHIMISCMCLGVASQEGYGLAFLYCLGHGLSAGVMFLFLWAMYEISGSRNWSILKWGVNSGFVRCLMGASLCTVASLPPTAQFFCEVFMLLEAGEVGLIYIFLLCLYLFFGGLVPLFLLGGLLTRHFSIGLGGGYIFVTLGSVSVLLIWSFMLFLAS